MSRKILFVIPLSLIIVLILTVILITGTFANPDFSIEVADRNGFAEETLNDGAIVQYIGDLNVTFGSAGSGVFDSFVRLQGNDKKTVVQKGYNTDGAREWDTKAGAFTHSILLSEIPVIEVGGGLYWEFFADINDSDNTPRISLDDMELYLTLNPNLSGYPFVGSAVNLYDFDTANGGHFILINDVNQGSGRGDLRYLVPLGSYDPGICSYGNPACTTYLVLYSVWGGKGSPYGFDGGFEEWKVKKYPVLQVSKDINGAYDTRVTWTIDKITDASYDLFTGESVTHSYQVSVDPTEGDPENIMVYGTITIVGDDDEAVNATITDLFNGVPTTITGCSVEPVDGKYPIAAGATVTCDYEHSLGAITDGTNVAQATFTVNGVSLAYQGSDSILAAEYVETKTGYPDIDVTDTNPGAGPWSTSAASATWTYERTFTCDGDAGTHINTATITQTGQTDTATVVINCHGLTVTKDANTSYTRTYQWDITKSVSPDTWDLFDGESGTSEYTVAVDKTGFTDDTFAVEGTITIVNAHPNRAAELTQVKDLISGVGEVSVDCGGATSVPALDSLLCSYSSSLPDATSRTNTATATMQLYDFPAMTDADTMDYSGGADIVFDSNSPTVEVYDEVNVTDSNGEGWGPVSDDASWIYERTFTCDGDEGTHGNIATIVETGQNDSASVTVNCYDLEVTKDAQTSLTRTFFWTIDKVVDNPGPIQVDKGQDVNVNYTITVDKASDPGYTDSDWAVSGNITVSNVGNPIPAVISNVSDVLPGSSNLSVVCGVAYPYTIAAGGSLVCTYSADLPDAATRENSATVTQQLYDYDKNKQATASGTQDYGGSASVDFSSATVNLVDESVHVTDDYGTPSDPSDDLDFGYVNYNQVPKQFTYPRTISTGDAACGLFQIDNTAKLVTIDTSTVLTDPATAVIEVICRVEACTPGFWQGGNGSKLWNSTNLNDPHWNGVNPQPFHHNTIFNDFFSTYKDPRVDGQTMFQIVSNEGGIANSAEKAARDMVAAYLNEAWFPTTYPAASLVDLENMWYSAVIGGDAGLEAFHQTVSGWNDPPDHVCPAG